MRWEDERYVRIYTRDTVDWLGLSFIAQGLFCLILRKVDRAGLLKLGKQGKRAVSIVIGHPGDWARLEPALEELLADGCIEIRGEHLVVPNFIEAQECAQSDAQRKRESRAKARDVASAVSVVPDISSQNVTGGHESGQKVTNGHEVSQAVTSGHSVPSRTVPSRAAPQDAADTPSLEPEVVQFQRALEQRMCRTAPLPGSSPDVLKQIRAALQRLPMAEAVELVAKRDADGARNGSRVKTLKLVAAVLADEVSARATAPATPKSRRVVGADDNGQPIFEEAAR